MSNNDERQREELDLNAEEEFLLEKICTHTDFSRYERLSTPPGIHVSQNRKSIPYNADADIPPGDVISMENLNKLFPVLDEVHGKEIEVKVGDDENVSLLRKLYPDAGIVWNLGLYVREKGTGLGVKMFASQVENCAKANFKQIHTLAYGKPYKGYYLWPCLGYQARVTYSPGADEYHDSRLQEIPHTTDAKNSRTYLLSDITSVREGLDFWKQHGYGMKMTFDLSPNGLSRARLESYFSARYSSE